MSAAEYKKYFSEHTQGKRMTTQIWDAVVHPLRDPPMSEHEYASFQNIVSHTRKKASSLVGLKGGDNNKALFLANLAYQCKLPIYYVSEDFFNEINESELAGLLAAHETQNVILFIDEADKLIAEDVEYDDSGDALTRDHLFKLFGSRQGLTVFSIDKPNSIEKLQLRNYSLIQLD